MSDLSTDELARLMGQKRQVLSQLHEVGQRQAQLVASGDVGLLLKLLSAKQTLIQALQSVERSLAPFHLQDPETRTWPTPEHRAACAADAAECRRLLDEVIAMEKTQETQMTERRDAVAAQLQKVHTAHHARDAYQSQQRPQATNPHDLQSLAQGVPKPNIPMPNVSENLPTAGRLDLASEA